MRPTRLLVLASLALTCFAQAQRPLTLTILHTNDLHAHAEPTLIARKPYGGYARHATLIKNIRKQERKVLLLNGGDCFQGTLYFNAYEGLVEAAYMNAVGYHGMAVGNHEFDKGPKPLGAFAKVAAFPLLAANLDVSREPALAGYIHASAIVDLEGDRIGLVGAITPDTPNISSPGPTVRFLELEQSVQRAVDDLTRKGINKIVLVTHLGYQQDQQLAARLRNVDVVVGGHSHSPLGTPNLPGWPTPSGPYPTRVKDRDGREVLVVQAWDWGKVLGRLKVDFSADGRITRVREAGPIPVDETVPEDPIVGSMMAAFKKPIEAMANQPVGEAASEITRSYTGNNPMASIVADAMLAATARTGSVAAFINAGGVRAGLDPGPITYGEAIGVQPFGNTLVVVEMAGADLLKVLEQGVPDRDRLGGMLFPSEGTSYRADLSKPAGSRISEVVVAGKPLDPLATYKLTFLSFTASGGDSHFHLRDLKTPRVDTGDLDVDALIEYVKKHSPLRPPAAQRLVLITP